MELVDKVKPKSLEEMFSILSSIRTFPGNLQHHKQAIGLKLQTLTKVWPASRFYVKCKKQLNRLLKSWNVKVEFSKGNAKPPPVTDANGEVQADQDEDTTSPKKKKKKKKSKEKLKNEKEFKLKQAKDQENSDIPSFSELVQDTLNNDVVESGKGKRKASDEEVKKKKKKKK